MMAGARHGVVASFGGVGADLCKDVLEADVEDWEGCGDGEVLMRDMVVDILLEVC